MFRAFALSLLLAAPAAAEDVNPLIGAWVRAEPTKRGWPAPDPRQRLTFTADRMIVGVGGGEDLRRYEVSGSTVVAETRTGRVYRFRMTGSDHMCLVPAALADAFGPLRPEPRCYVRRVARYDPTLV